MQYGLIGGKLGHSFSPELHALFGRYDYGLTELTEAELGPFLEQRAFKGLNVTMPYKQAVIPYLDELSEAARETGAVNTVVNREGRLFGDNTDLEGLLALIGRTGQRFSHAPQPMQISSLTTGTCLPARLVTILIAPTGQCRTQFPQSTPCRWRQSLW